VMYRAIVLFSVLLAIGSIQASISELPPQFSSANFYYSGIAAQGSDTMKASGKYEYLATDDDSFAHQTVSVVFNGSSMLEETFTTQTADGLSEYSEDAGGCFVRLSRPGDQRYPTCNGWTSASDPADPTASIWSQQCTSQVTKGNVQEVTSVFVCAKGTITRVKFSSSTMFNDSKVTQMLDLKTTKWIATAPSKSDVTPPDSSECVDISAPASQPSEDVAVEGTGNNVREKRRWCWVCLGDVGGRMLPILGASAISYVACNPRVYKPLCWATRFQGCEDSFDNACDQCRRNNYGQCSSAWLVRRICEHMGDC